MTSNSIEDLRETYVTRGNLARKTKRYLELIAHYNHREIPFKIDQAALLVIDMQRCFLEPAYPLYTENGQAIIPNLRLLIENFRQKKRPVLFAAQMNRGEFIDRGEVLRVWWPATPLEGSRDTELAREIKPLPSEKVIIKRRYSAFHATDLELTLRTMEIRQLIVAGLFTNVCVEATVRDAFMHDFFVFIPADACASLNEELHLGALRTLALWYAKILTTRDLLS
ncbi:MAG TPA: isochorismatase family cysteine hydrolase [archaeon]|nr:isochorismatase family cysteine hydrolase [archaeon]